MESIYDIVNNRDAWTATGAMREVKNPNRSILTFWRPRLINQRLFYKRSGEDFIYVWMFESADQMVAESAEFEEDEHG